jgi:hypothetical protein
MTDKKSHQERIKANKKRLEKTETGRVLLELRDLCGGRVPMARALDINVRSMDIWFHRGQVSEQGAYLVERTPFFADKGWTKEKVRPDIKEMQWHGPNLEFFSGFLGRSNEDKEVSRNRHEKRLEDRAASKLEKEIEGHKEFLARVNGEIEE